MILVFPGILGGAEGVALLAALDFVAGDLREERTAAPLADEFVDGGKEIDGEDYVRSPARRLGHTPSVT